MSFSSRVKDEIIQLSQKNKKCCLFSFVYGLLLQAKEDNGYKLIKTTNVENAETLVNIGKILFPKKNLVLKIKEHTVGFNKEILRYFTIAEIKENVFKCNNCREYFFKGLFYCTGTINNPEKSYRLELVLSSSSISNEVLMLLDEINIEAKIAIRSAKTVLYLRKSESIEDFLAYIGASNAAFEIMNAKINKDVRNNANRVTNCDSANINKALSAGEKYNKVIKDLIDNGDLERLPEPLKELALLKINNSELTFSDLGARLLPTISKSGVYHRLEKIVDFYNDYKRKK